MSTADQELRESVKHRYGEAVTAAVKGKAVSCCGSSSSCEPATKDPITRELYSDAETAGLPPEAVLASFGCGKPDGVAANFARRGRARPRLGRGSTSCVGQASGPHRQATGLDMTPIC